MRRWKNLGRVWMVAVFGFMYVPIAVLIAFSFNESKSRNVWAGFSLRWYKNLLGDEMILQALGVSLVVAFASAIIATVLGTLAAIGVNNMSRRRRAVVLNLSYVPIVNPEIVTPVPAVLRYLHGGLFRQKRGRRFAGCARLCRLCAGRDAVPRRRAAAPFGPGAHERGHGEAAVPLQAYAEVPGRQGVPRHAARRDGAVRRGRLGREGGGHHRFSRGCGFVSRAR